MNVTRYSPKSPNTKKELIPHLKETRCWDGLNPLVLKRIEESKTFYTLNNALNDVYDFADANKIWLGFMP